MAKTVIHKDQTSFFGNDNLLDVATNKSFAQMIFELLSEKQPSPAEVRVFEFILNLSIDHGPDTPSGMAVIAAAKDGKTISEAVAAGVLQINDSHGGAIEPAMELLYKIKKQKLNIKIIVQEYIKEDKKIPGHGHRLYTDVDPRAQAIFAILEQEGLGNDFISIGKEIEGELARQKGKKLPFNVDGAIAVALCSFEWQPRLGKAVFIIARTPGLCGQFLNTKI